MSKTEPPTEYRIIKRGGMFLIQTRFFSPNRTGSPREIAIIGDGWVDIPETAHTTLPSAKRHKLRLMAGDYTQPFEVVG